MGANGLDLTSGSGNINLYGNVRMNGNSLISSQWTISGAGIFYDGNVGIGAISSPFTGLHVKKNASWGTPVWLDATSLAGGKIWTLQSSGGDHFVGQGKLLIRNETNGVNAFIIDGNGNACLNGDLKAKKVVVEAGGCDFVFEPGYDKMNWKEKQLYYLTHKRLPFMVSAKEMKEKGLDIGSGMQGILQNIEEDRMDITELFERMEKLERKNERLESELSVVKKENEELKKQIEKK